MKDEINEGLAGRPVSCGNRAIPIGVRRLEGGFYPCKLFCTGRFEYEICYNYLSLGKWAGPEQHGFLAHGDQAIFSRTPKLSTGQRMRVVQSISASRAFDCEAERGRRFQAAIALLDLKIACHERSTLSLPRDPAQRSRIPARGDAG